MSHRPAPFTGGEKPKNLKQTLFKLLRYCKAYQPVILVAVVFAMLGSICTLIGPSQLSKITNLILEGMRSTIDLSAIGKICLILAILYAVGLLVGYIQGFIMATITQRLSKNLRTDVSHKINRLPLKYFDGTTIGDTLSRITNDVDTIGQTMNQSINMLISSGTLFIGSLIMMFWTNAWMAITAVLSTMIGFALMGQIMKHSQKYFRAQQQVLGRLNGHIEEIYTGHAIVKVYNGGKQAKKEFDHLNETLYGSAWKSQFLSGLMMPMMMFIGNFGYVAVCVLGAVLAMNGRISFGTIVAFMVYIRLFSQPLSQIAQGATGMQSTAAASERVFSFLEQPELSDESGKTARLTTVKGDVEFDRVVFGYDKEKPVIHGFNARIKAGQKVAIVGPTGAGKTTLVNLLMRFYELDSGEIRIDGIPIQTLTRENIHALFCMVLQDTWLFEGTIRENIVYSKEGVTNEAIIAACKAVDIHHFIKTLPKGYDTILDDKASLSAGQKQLITIARAMIENAPMLILDEATSSVDTRTEVQIQKAMDQLTVGRTAFVIAHRLSTIKHADLILVMREGDIVESGTHEALLAQNGFYADLYNSQFEEAEGF